eukprot:6982429-Pyramimonas_sp.AAC.1
MPVQEVVGPHPPHPQQRQYTVEQARRLAALVDEGRSRHVQEGLAALCRVWANTAEQEVLNSRQ